MKYEVPIAEWLKALIIQRSVLNESACPPWNRGGFWQKYGPKSFSPDSLCALILYSFKYIKSSLTPVEVQIHSIFCYTYFRLISSFQTQLLNQ